MTKCEYWDSGWCYAPDYLKTNAVQGACIEPEYCPYLKSQMTEKEKIEREIKILQKKLSFLEEMENHRSPVEEAFKRIYNVYPSSSEKSVFWTDNDEDTWIAFQNGYNAAQEDYKVGEYQEPEQVNTFAPKELEELVKEGVKQKEEYSYKITDEHGETNPYKQYLNSVEDEKKMEELGFVKNSDGNWTAQSLEETAQERGERVHKEMEEQVKKLQEKEWNVETKTNLKPHWEPKPQNEHEVAEGLREAFVKAQKSEKWKEIQKLIDEGDNDKNFKNSLDIIKEWGEKNKPKTLYQICMEWWDEVFVNQMDEDICVDVLVSKIDKEFIPPSSDRNDYQWNKCLKIMREKLR